MDYDSPWKETVEQYFPSFIGFFFPKAHADIDWNKGYNFLDKELEKIIRDAELGKRLADKLVQVWRHDGEEEYLLVHIEIQGDRDRDFAKRMYIYNYRIFDRYDRKVASLAVLADLDHNWRPDHYSYELWGTHISISFPVIKLLDYQNSWSELEASKNPFATVVMAHLKAKETARNKDTQSRYQWKLNLSRRLYNHGYSREEILNLYRFIDWVLILPEELERKFLDELSSFEEKRKMQYVTSAEKLGIQKGMQQGMQQGEKRGETRFLRRQLIRRFGKLPAWVEERLTQATTDQLENWVDQILDAKTLEEVFEG